MSFFDQVDSEEPFSQAKKRPQTAAKPLDFFQSSKKSQRNSQKNQSSHHALQTVETAQQQQHQLQMISIKVQTKKKKRKESQKIIVGS